MVALLTVYQIQGTIVELWLPLKSEWSKEFWIVKIGSECIIVCTTPRDPTTYFQRYKILIKHIKTVPLLKIL